MSRSKCIIAGLVGAGLLAAPAWSIDLSSNIELSAAGSEVASGSRQLAASFTTDGSQHALSSVTLILSTPGTSAAAVDVYSDGGLEPGDLIGTLASPVSLPVSAGEAVFTTSGMTLNANTKYWIVLRSVTGDVNWSWTGSNSGTGTGFTNEWAISEDSGSFWWSNNIYPLQMSVTVDEACAADFDGNGMREVPDIFAFLSAWFANDASADIDGTPGIGVPDIFAFLSLWFAGC